MSLMMAEQHVNDGFGVTIAGEAPDADDNAIALAGDVQYCLDAGPVNMCRCA